MPSPQVSIIIPVYNGARTLGRAIESVIAQTFQDLELIIIDDGSTDETCVIASGFTDPRIRIYSYENAGLGAARNRGIGRSTGEYISFLDADDFWNHHKIEEQLSVLKEDPSAGMAYSWTIFIDPYGRFLFAKEPMRYSGKVESELLLGCFIAGGSNVLMRRRCIEDIGFFDEGLSAAEDWDYWLRVARQWKVLCVPAYHVFYRFTEGAMSTDLERIVFANREVLGRGFAHAGFKVGRIAGHARANLCHYWAFLCFFRTTAKGWASAGLRWLLKSAIFYPPNIFTRKYLTLLACGITLGVLPARLRYLFRKLMLKMFGAFQRMRHRDLNSAVVKYLEGSARR